MLRVMGMLFEPVERIAGDFECQLVARHRAHDAGGIDGERRAIDMFFVTELSDQPALRVDEPVEPPCSLSRITRSRKAIPWRA